MRKPHHCCAAVSPRIGLAFATICLLTLVTYPRTSFKKVTYTVRSDRVP
jgi:hypothetical protein